MNRKALLQRLVVLSTLAAAGAANAAGTGVDASGVLSGIDSSSVVTAIVAAGAIMALPGFAKWAIKKTASFFG
ncbi:MULTISPECIES: hypothetical protein [unclassified Cupriavidus]|uniref:hypothetical protein n=1 Tax=unclassified Cupriavidus TaxID=2640874 RepID=UPI001BFFE39F|nr:MULTISPECIES: hypothetical protein [unclassified Cupriavidus]QWE95022.1 hypothetical protein KLP38_03390 [Cupriavidus sp. EM10]